MWKLSLTVALFVIVTVANAARVNPDPSTSDGTGPVFRCQVGQRLGSEPDSMRMIVTTSVSYDNLSFLRTDTGFAATIELVTTIFRKGSGLVKEQIRNIDVTTAVYAETNSRTKHAVRSDEFLVLPGEYSIYVTVKDNQSRKKSKWEGKYTFAPADSMLRLSDIFFASKDSSLAQRNIPRVVGKFPSTEHEVEAHIQLFSRASGEINLTWAVVNQKHDTIRTQTAPVTPNGTVQTFVYMIKFDSLTAEKYSLCVEAVGNGRRETQQREFSIYIPGIPQSVTDIDLAIRQLKYIASNDENSRFHHSNPQEREQLFKEFWKKRDPTPDTEQNELMDEYFIRVEYANDKFSTNRQGWETDRGRIYILYGEPTDIERHPFDSNSRPYEIWFYTNSARRFVFVDYTGFNDYVLAEPDWGY